MRLDQPEVVARRLWRAAVRRRASLPPPTPERFFVALQRLAPGVVDLGLKSVRRKVERARAEEAARSLHSEADSKP